MISEETERFRRSYQAMQNYLQNDLHPGNEISQLRKMQIESMVGTLISLLQDPREGELSDNDFDHMMEDAISQYEKLNEDFRNKFKELAQDMFKNRNIPKVKEIQLEYIMGLRSERVQTF